MESQIIKKSLREINPRRPRTTNENKGISPKKKNEIPS
jgi:hypothetical protein